MKAVPPASPSTRAQTQNFSELQSDPDLAIHCNRPQSAAHPTPVTLLHPIFGQFVDECETLRPKYEDNAFALEAFQIISALYPSEVSRKDGILGLFERHKIPLHGCSIQGIPPSTDADTGFPFAIAEMESDYVEPYAQAAFYYLESTREHWAMAYPASPLPCIIVTVIGSCLAFAGAIWDHRPCVQVLSAAIPFHFHPYDTDLQSTAARHLGAFKRAVQRLRDYYADIVPRLANVPAPHDKLFPYPTCFTPLAGPQGVRDFRYSPRPSDERLVFFGNILGDNTGICIKFVRNYSSAVHQYFSNLGLAPRLLGLESLSGGWKMVVMDRVDQEYIDLYSSLIDRDRPLDEELRFTLYDTLHTSLVGLHRAGFVHGDIQAPSIMISKNRRAKFLLLDFDWAGEIGMARYPPDVYRGERLWRPDGVSGCAPITAAHDVQMLDHIFMADAPKSPSPKLTPTSSASSQAPSKRSLASDGSEARVSKRRREGM
ncbi:hypothetical protein BD779DRAFT_1452885 [Infundibulicybe gibba]|nr:hypothetical protein BD779DRAFT_1452885 [Infundibulicybe gibba]